MAAEAPQGCAHPGASLEGCGRGGEGARGLEASQGLRLDYYSLKGRLKGTPAAATHHGPVEFVEIPGKMLSPGPATVVELQDREGLRLRVELKDAAGAESLARSLWRERR